MMLNNCWWLIFIHASKKKTVCTVSALRSRKYKSYEQGLPGNHQVDMRVGLWRRSNSVLPLQRLPAFCFSLKLHAVGFQGYHGAGDRGMRIREVKILWSSLFLLRFCHFFFFNKFSQVAARFCLVFWVLKTLIMTIFVSVHLAFREEIIFRGLY